ncbi:MAG: hypothetical protein ACRYFR_20400 [Janthinobacterium lividum]
MKTALSLLTSLALASLLLPARAQTAPAVQSRASKPAAVTNPKTTGAAGRKPGAYSGPYVVSDTKKLGQQFIERSRPADNLIMAYPRPQK